ncbi:MULTISPECIES: hypothetical protein [Agrobacterium]|uniref:hypothetical protein n=1 Tax=Agrobacterium TaxID=357 RepID=UPI0027BAACBD|nr:hypothetical protein [Agrobacterium sp. SORGH_AS_0745]
MASFPFDCDLLLNVRRPVWFQRFIIAAAAPNDDFRQWTTPRQRQLNVGNEFFGKKWCRLRDSNT